MKISKNSVITQQPLSPDEIQGAISTERLGKKIHWFETLPSTNIRAQELARQGAAEGEIVLAEGQTQGQGKGREELGFSAVSQSLPFFDLATNASAKLYPSDHFDVRCRLSRHHSLLPTLSPGN